VRNHREKGMALATTLIVMMLLASMMIGLAWLVMTDTKLGGNNSDRQEAYYGAEAGMEALTASLENLIDVNFAPTATQVNGLATGMSSSVAPPGINYYAPGSTTADSGLVISFKPITSGANIGNPASNWGTVPTGSYAGMVALLTPYTLQVTARSTFGSEVRLQREIQTVEIPVFQFGVFSQPDVGFHAGENFNFGGRVATNGNLWLAEGSGDTLTMSSKVTAAGEIITSNLMNGLPTAQNYSGVVNITTGSGYANLVNQNPNQSVTGTTNYIGNVSAENSSWPTMVSGVYGSNIATKATGAKTLNLAIATEGLGQTIDLIRPPVPGENVSNPTKYQERDYYQASLRILLSDYGPSGGCTDSDIMNLPGVVTTTMPVDLATLVWDATNPAADGNTVYPYATPPAWLAATGQIGISIFPLPESAAPAGTTTYTTVAATNGYWIQTPSNPVLKHYATDAGCIKIEYQNVGGASWTDTTKSILLQGFTGRNINPQIGAHNVPTYASTPAPQETVLTGLINAGQQVYAQGPTANAAVNMVGCADPSRNAIIRLARLRDNPSTALGTNNYCGNNPSTGAWSGLANNTGTCTVAGTSPHCPSILATDYWPNVIYDTREAIQRDVALQATQLTLAGAMHYTELDVNNLAAWFVANSALLYAPNGFSVYFSDRRGNVADPNSPPSVGNPPMKTGGFGYEDIVNNFSDPTNGCPNGALDQGEDNEGDYNNSGVDTAPLLRTYGKTPTVSNPATVVPMTNVPAAAIANNPNCGGPATNWPFAQAVNNEDLRENPPLVFRRALKLVDASTIGLGCNTTAGPLPCGLTVVSENPAYIQGDYNNPGLNTNFSGAPVSASVIADTATILSDNWNDVNSFISPYNPGGRGPVATTYRLALASGKVIAFYNTQQGTNVDTGDDGGVHNFMHYLENWGNGSKIYYVGSFVSMWYSHQAYGTYKCCNTVYGVPTRAYNFDGNFLTPALLPPLTPMMRMINTVGFTQMILPTQ